jgi:hypothetical protein
LFVLVCIERDWWLSAEAAVEYGLVVRIIERKTELQKILSFLTRIPAVYDSRVPALLRSPTRAQVLGDVLNARAD